MSGSHRSFLRDTRYISAVVARGNYSYVKYNKMYNICVRLSFFLICSKCEFIHVFGTFEGGYNCLYSVYFIILMSR